MSELVSVIVPVYDAEKYLSDCIESLLAQSYRPFELIFVNDGSTDSSQALLERYAARHDCMRVVHQKNMGVSSARNAALEIARGAYIAFCDSDNVVHADWLAELVSALESVDAHRWPAAAMLRLRTAVRRNTRDPMRRGSALTILRICIAEFCVRTMCADISSKSSLYAK